MKTRIAIVDLGTNTFHLLVAEVTSDSYSFIHREKIPVGLGKGGINDRIISPEAQNRAFLAASHIRDVLSQFSIDHSICVATSALRNADNKSTITEEFKLITGLDVEIISGDKEAEYIFEGVSLGINLESTDSLIMDIGGGSVEFIIGSESGIKWKKSFEIGAQRLLDRFQQNDPITKEEIANVENFALSNLGSLYEAIKLYNPSSLVGSSGTFDTLSEIYRHESKIENKVDDTELPLTFEAIMSIYNDIISKNRNERLQIPGMIEMRVDMIVVASILIQVVLYMHEFQQVRVSSYALKEGVFASVLKSLKYPV